MAIMLGKEIDQNERWSESENFSNELKWLRSALRPTHAHNTHISISFTHELKIFKINLLIGLRPIRMENNPLLLLHATEKSSVSIGIELELGMPRAQSEWRNNLFLQRMNSYTATHCCRPSVHKSTVTLELSVFANKGPPPHTQIQRNESYVNRPGRRETYSVFTHRDHKRRQQQFVICLLGWFGWPVSTTYRIIDESYRSKYIFWHFSPVFCAHELNRQSPTDYWARFLIVSGVQCPFVPQPNF